MADVACLDPALLVNPQTPVIELLARPAFLPKGRVVVVDAARRPVGIVSITDIERRIRAGALLNERSPYRTQPHFPSGRAAAHFRSSRRAQGPALLVSPTKAEQLLDAWRMAGWPMTCNEGAQQDVLRCRRGGEEVEALKDEAEDLAA